MWKVLRGRGAADGQRLLDAPNRRDGTALQPGAFCKAHRAFARVDEQGNVTENGVLYGRLRMLCSAGRVNEAENLLFERLDAPGGENFLPAALQFYQDIQKWEDAALEQAGFSRTEIWDGLAGVRARLQSARMERSENA